MHQDGLDVYTVYVAQMSHTSELHIGVLYHSEPSIYFGAFTERSFLMAPFLCTRTRRYAMVPSEKTKLVRCLTGDNRSHLGWTAGWTKRCRQANNSIV